MSKNLRQRNLFVLVLLGLGSVAFAESIGEVHFYALGKPSLLKIHGESTDLAGTLTQEKGKFQGKFSLKMDGFQTGMKLRDRHLKNKVFDVKKYPETILVLKDLPIQFGEGLKFQGKLKFHGVERSVEGKVDLKQAADKRCEFKAMFPIKLSDFDIQPPKFAGMKIEEEIKLEVRGTSECKAALEAGK